MITIKLNSDKPEKQEQLYDCAAWYTQWVLNPGEYPAERKTDQYGNVFYSFLCDATIESDNFQSLFCGNSIGKRYDTLQNTGKQGARSLVMRPEELLKDSRVTISDNLYDQVLAEAISNIDYDIKITMMCLNDSSPDWMSGHAEKLAKLTNLYSDCHGVKARREYNAKNDGKGWPEIELRVKR